MQVLGYTHVFNLRVGLARWLTKLPRFQGVQPGHVRVESPCFCFHKRKADNKLFKVRSVDPDCPLSDIIPKKKELDKVSLRNKSANHPDINTERLKNAFVKRLIFRHNL